ncbi:50S ribosomal protein L22 [Eubacteriales bacterium OttesenSCG-928-M02]|nr:50S ribosomal protein L22 [Eubacteriales bacterium OttesenSCG-928-M02]
MATKQREKAKARKENRDTRPRAVAKYVRISPRKVRYVVDMVRGKSVEEAEAILLYTPHGASEPVGKLVKSAAANAENNMDIPKDSLYIAEIYVDQGPTLKRYRPRAQGRATRILKRTSHITVVLDQIQ